MSVKKTTVTSTLLTNKGHPLLTKDGFTYKINKRTPSKIYWICKTKNCTAHVHTDLNNKLLFVSGEHNHLLEPEDQQVRHFRGILKERVINETVPISKIYDEELVKAQFSPEVLAKVPLIHEIQAGLNHARRKLTPVLPNSITFDIPESYQLTGSGKKFLMFDTLVSRRKRMLVFASPEQLQLLFDSSIIFMDGTFTATPPLFDQVFTIHALKFESGFPCAFCLLPDRKKSTYQELFKELKNTATAMGRLFQPERIISDFETGLIPAISTEFPQAVHSGCYFHFTQCIYRRIQALGLAESYSQNDEIRTPCRKLMTLALLPPNDVESAFYNLRASLDAQLKTQLRQLFLYFDSYWMTDVPLTMWNVHGYEHKTNNICEGFHSRLNRRIQRAHSNIWAFIKCLMSEENRFQHLLIRLSTGVQRRPKSTVADAMQKRINVLNERYNNKEINAEELLNALSLVIANKK